MATVKIGDREFTTKGYSQCSPNATMPSCWKRPRSEIGPWSFCGKLGSISQADRDAAIKAFVGSPGWDQPPRDAMVRAA